MAIWSEIRLICGSQKVDTKRHLCVIFRHEKRLAAASLKGTNNQLIINLLFLWSCIDTAVRVDVCRLGLISPYILDCGLCVVSYLLVIVLVDGSECEEY